MVTEELKNLYLQMNMLRTGCLYSLYLFFAIPPFMPMLLMRVGSWSMGHRKHECAHHQDIRKSRALVAPASWPAAGTRKEHGYSWANVGSFT
jgi:hypothetical protein